MGTILNLRTQGGHRAAMKWTRHAVEGSAAVSQCGLYLGRLGPCNHSIVPDHPAVQGEIRNCKRCERIAGSSLGEER